MIAGTGHNIKNQYTQGVLTSKPEFCHNLEWNTVPEMYHTFEFIHKIYYAIPKIYKCHFTQ
jgi:hypothetical protein